MICANEKRPQWHRHHRSLRPSGDGTNEKRPPWCKRERKC